MPLKFKYTDAKEIPAAHQEHYVERNGAWVLQVEGGVDKAELEKARTGYGALKNELDQFKARYEGIDPEEVKRLAEEKRKLEEEKQLKAGELDKVMEKRKADWDKQLASVTAERDQANARLTAIQIDQGVLTAATKRGLRSTAIPDITARARSVFRLVNGVPHAFEADGQTVRLAKDGFSPMTLEEWVEAQVSDAPHLFESNAGGGAVTNGAGTGTGSGRSVANPFRKDTWNVTEQMRLLKHEPQLAARLSAVAAVN
jgi:hypothetical protein